MKITLGKITPAINAVAFRALSLFLPFAAALFFAACNQDDIFYQVENETELRDPRIEGGPSKIVKLKNDNGTGHDLYVASGVIWTYPESGGGWRKIPNQPPGIKVLDIAVAGDYLYAVTSRKGVSLGDSGYYRLKGEAWEPIQAPESYPYPNAIYGAGDVLFAAAANGSRYAVYALKDEATEFTLIREASAQGEGLLMGAAQFPIDGEYFISLGGLGVFHLNSLREINQETDLVAGSTGKGNFTGFVEVDGTLLMVSSSGVICQLSANDTDIKEENSHSLGFSFFGAIAVWRDDPKATEAPTDPNKRLLLFSRKGSNSNYSGYGYYECQLPEGFKLKSLGIMEPQFTVEKNAAYKNSLGKRAITSIIQAPDGFIFASTQSYNLWACRDGEWNYE